MKTLIKRISVGLTLMLGSGLAALAQTNTGQSLTLQGALDKANTTLSNAVNAIMNVASIVLGLAGIIMIVWNFIQRGRGDSQSNDKMMQTGIYLLIAIGLIQIIRLIMFGR